MSKDCRPRKWPGGSIARKRRCGRTSRTRAPSFAGISKEGSGRKMKHPARATLALLAGGDLGIFARWRTARHVARCERCRDEAAAFEATREIATDLGEIPELQWNRLAAEMKANIRLGLAAGACVRTSEPILHDTPLFTKARAVVAFASIVALFATSLVLQRPVPTLADEGTVVQATSDGIQLRNGDRALRLGNPGVDRDAHISYTSDAQGAVGVRTVDPQTDFVTISRVYAD